MGFYCAIRLLPQALGCSLHRGPDVPPSKGVGDGGLDQLLGGTVRVGERQVARMDTPCEYTTCTCEFVFLAACVWSCFSWTGPDQVTPTLSVCTNVVVFVSAYGVIAFFQGAISQDFVCMRHA